MVIGNDVKQQLAPFQENNMGDCPAEYLEFEDCTEEVTDAWDALTPEAKDEYDSIAHYAESYHGYKESEDEPGRFGYVDNPNSKWDWYQVGGRWSGFLKLKPGAKGTLGTRSLLDRSPDERSGYADQTRKGDIDFEGMRDEAGEKAGTKWDIVNPVIAPHASTFTSWATVQEQAKDEAGGVNWEVARDMYHGQPLRKAVAEAARDSSNPNRDLFVWLDDIDRYLKSREEFVQAARDSAVSTFAVLNDGQWVERGEMGWWGIVSNEGDKTAWDRDFNTMLDALPDDTLITIVDCHT
jgi:hypothetical protein